MAALSLRARLLVGAVLWTIGLFTVACIITTTWLFRFSWSPHIFHAIFERSRHAFLVAVLCMIGGFWQMKRALAYFRDLRAGLAAVRDGRGSRIDGMYPSE